MTALSDCIFSSNDDDGLREGLSAAMAAESKVSLGECAEPEPQGPGKQRFVAAHARGGTCRQDDAAHVVPVPMEKR